MKIPIYNSLYSIDIKSYKTSPLDFKILNNLNFKEVDQTKFPLVKLLKKLPIFPSLYETILVTINDFFVHKFLENHLTFNKLIFLINKFSNLKEFQKYKNIKPKNVDEIYRLRDYVSSKMNSLGI